MAMLFLNLEGAGILLGVWLLLKNLFLEEEYFKVSMLTQLTMWVGLLVLMLYLMMLSVEFSYKMSLNMLFFSLLRLISTSSFLSFFLFYEMVFILITFVIVLLGYSYERMMAAYSMMLYSLLFSSPVLMMMFILDYVSLMKSWLPYSSSLKYFLVGSFMVKFPVFGFHYWLPVAHVEASTIGSMVLAGVLLKLGAIGLLYSITYLNFMVKLHWMVLGVLVVMLSILNLSDLKMMIAYSSIAHTSMVFHVMMLGTKVGEKGAILMLFYHGFISPLMFWLVGMLGWWKTRSLMVVKFMSFSFFFLMMIFLLVIMNMSFPPFMGFLSEILMLKSLVSNELILWVLALSVLFSCYYNVYLFWSFNGVMGWIFKVNFFSMDVFLFTLMGLFLNL